MKKFVFAALVASIYVLPANAVQVTGKASLSLGESVARYDALNNALLEASHLNNVYVAGSTEVNDLQIEKSHSIVKTSSLITDVDILEEGECGEYYCVTVDAQFGEITPKNTPYADTSLSIEFQVHSSEKIGYFDSLDKLKQAVESNINGTEGVYISSGTSKSAPIVSSLVSFDLIDAPKGFFSIFKSERKEVHGSISISNSTSSFVESFTLDGYLYLNPNDNNFSDLARQLSAKILRINSQLPTQLDFEIVNTHGSSLILQADNFNLGAIYEVVYLDSITNEYVMLSGIVERVSNGVTLMKLSSEPLSSWRVERINKVVN